LGVLLFSDKEPEKEKPRNPTKNVSQNHVSDKRGGRNDRDRGNSDRPRGGGARNNPSRGGRTGSTNDRPKERREGKREEKGKGRGGGGAPVGTIPGVSGSGSSDWHDRDRDNKGFQQSAKPPRFQNQQPHRYVANTLLCRGQACSV